jgi:hypothetical protein
MVEMAEIFRRHGPEYLAKYGERMPSSQKKAMRDILDCRTEILGGETYFCKKCQDYRYSYHSCGNRHCPKCGNDKNEEWLKKQSDFLLPVVYFLVTVTLPQELRRLARNRQKTIYDMLFSSSSAALLKLAQDSKYIGGKIGLLGVLQTWTADMFLHPHVHYIVPGGGLSPDGSWIPSRDDFLVPDKAFSIIFRAKFRDELKAAGLIDQVPPAAWKKDWVVDIQPVGTGEHALKYLAPYVFRVAISNYRIKSLENGQVTFQYKNNDGELKYTTLDAEKFIGRFLQHVLPQGFMKVRYYGLFSTKNRSLLRKVGKLLGLDPTEKQEPNQESEKVCPDQRNCRCPKCGNLMTIVETIRPKKNRSP